MRLTVLGDPIEHSLSPQLHNAALRAAGLAGHYDKRRVDRAGMEAAVAEIRRGDLDGANVTMPHKELAAELSDRLAPLARRARAANTLVRVWGDVVGHNTDVAGIRAAWDSAGLPETGRVLILGAGGAAAAAVLARDGESIAVSARNPERAQRLADNLQAEVAVVPWAEPVAGAVVVNATPLGMDGEPLPEAVLAAATGLFDMAYAAGATPAVELMRRTKRPVADGRAMLLHQAATAFELWTGHRAPIAAMAAALESPDTGP